jgi:hypothetical protein
MSMRDLVNSQARETNASERGAEMRGAPRFTLMLRSAKLIADGTEYLCIIRDVSETGVKLRLFHTVPRAAVLMIETASGQHYPMHLVWEAKGEAGFRFAQPINVDSFVSESGPYPKRPLRLRVNHPAVVRVGKESFSATILDISRQGARIAVSNRLAIRQKFCLEARELPLFEGTVCWRREPEYGVVFSQLMGLEELAQRAERMDRDDTAIAAAE